ncbi:MAG: amino acid permease [Thermoleophilaceae bacterium]
MKAGGDGRGRLGGARLPRGLTGPAAEAELAVARGLGAPALFAIVVSTVGASIYFALGVVAKDALGLTPLVFLIAGGFLIVTMWTYVEGNSLHPERGGASALARYAFNELWSFIAGWAILLDYLIVLSVGAFALSHYLQAFWAPAGESGIEMAITAAAIGFVAWSNIRGGISTGRLNTAARVGFVNLLLAVVLIVAGLVVAYEPGEIVDSIDLGTAPEWDDLVFAAVVATVAVTGIDAASGLAGELRVGRRKLRRFQFASTGVVLFTLVGLSVVALMAVPAVDGSTALGEEFIDAPVLGIPAAYEPVWLSDVLRYSVGAVGSLVLLQAMNVNMLGISRLSYALATHRQIPSALGRLHPTFATPYVTIGIASVAAFVLAIGDVEFLLGLFAFGAMLAFTIAHVSVIVLRFREGDRHVAFRVPLSVRVRGVSLPLPAVGGALFAFAAWVSVVVLHEGASIAGAVWMAAGLLLYVVYRKSQGKTLGGRFVISAEALTESRGVEYQSILVPVFGESIDDDIVGTAGRLAAEGWEEGEGGPMIEALYVIEVPMSLPIDARLPEEAIKTGRTALARAKQVGEEYENVEVATALVRGRAAGATIVDEARRRGVQAIVLGAERPTRMRGGVLLGGRGRARDRVVGEVTQYVVEKAPCRVILTAPPAGEQDARVGVRP